MLYVCPRRQVEGIARRREPGLGQRSGMSPEANGASLLPRSLGCFSLNQLLERGLVADRVEVAVLGSKRTERFVAVNREPEMLDRVVCPTGEALAAREVVERPRVLG